MQTDPAYIFTRIYIDRSRIDSARKQQTEGLWLDHISVTLYWYARSETLCTGYLIDKEIRRTSIATTTANPGEVNREVKPRDLQTR